MFKRRILASAVAAVLSLVPGVALSQSTPDESLNSIIDKVNDALEAQGSHMRLFSAEAMSRGRSGHHLRKAVWRKHFERTNAEFVPFDSRRPWSGPVNGQVDDITFAIDQADAVPQSGGLTAAQTTAAIRRAMGTWDGVRCSGLVLTEVPVYADSGLAAWFLRGMPGGPMSAPPTVADITHAGFAGDLWTGMPDLGHTTIIHDDIVALTFTFVAADINAPGFPLTDVDGNGKPDILAQEIYYNANVAWKVDQGGDRRRGHDDDDDDDRSHRNGKRVSANSRNDAFDVQTVALHEAGHALSLEHYGKEVKRRDGKLDFTPEAVMNPSYTGTLQRLQNADVAAHCIGGWKNWPRVKAKK